MKMKICKAVSLTLHHNLDKRVAKLFGCFSFDEFLITANNSELILHLDNLIKQADESQQFQILVTKLI